MQLKIADKVKQLLHILYFCREYKTLKNYE